MRNADPNVPIADIPAASPGEQAERDRQVASQGTANRVTVKILSDMQSELGGFVAGDVAGFPIGEAASLVKRGLATYDLGTEPKQAGAEPMDRDFANCALTAHAAGDVVLDFHKTWEKYAPGERAGFNPDLARRLVAMGVARPAETTRILRTLRAIRDAIVGC